MAMFLEALDAVLSLWTKEAPYDIQGKYWNISTRRQHVPSIGQGIVAKPMQRPHPPIVATAVAPFSKGVTAAAARGWDPICANFLMPEWVATHKACYEEACRLGGSEVDFSNWRVAKNIFVAEDHRVAENYARGAGSPYVHYFSSVFTKLVKNGRSNLFKDDPSMPDDKLTLDNVLDRLVIFGTPDEVADKILAFREEVGPFGTLLYAGHDWRDVMLAKTSMRLMAERVIPVVNAVIGDAAVLKIA